MVARDGAVGVALRAGWSEDRIPVEARFFALVQTSGWAQPATCTVGTGSLSRGNEAGEYVTSLSYIGW
jgi:hypothetical protein